MLTATELKKMYVEIKKHITPTGLSVERMSSFVLSRPGCSFSSFVLSALDEPVPVEPDILRFEYPRCHTLSLPLQILLGKSFLLMNTGP